VRSSGNRIHHHGLSHEETHGEEEEASSSSPFFFEGAITVNAPALAEAAIDLPWLSPSAGSLVALVRSPASSVWMAVREDPGMVLLLLRQASASQGPALWQPLSSKTAALQAAIQLLEAPAFADWSQPSLQPIHETCLVQARLAEQLAVLARACPAECAWAGGLLAPLGWLAAAAVAPESGRACLDHADFPRRAPLIQQQAWGLDHTAIARRLCRRWHLPLWFAATIGNLGLPVGIAQTLGADPGFFQIVQLAVALVQRETVGLGLALNAQPAALVAELGLDHAAVMQAVAQALHSRDRAQAAWHLPAAMPLLADYLRLALHHEERSERVLLERLQSEVDHLQRALEEQCTSEKDRLRHQKLTALAELAAGASHEINNPLAVISGQAQYLLGRETDPGRAKSLQTIIGQAQRIHHILNDLMQYARPSPVQLQIVDIAEVVQAAAASLQELANAHQVRLMCPEPAPIAGRLRADPAQLKIILHNLLRNAIEAAPLEGWAGIRVQYLSEGGLEIIVEDNGPGLSGHAREHMFDPFYSGRSAGRGQGLGLPAAWRLARQNGGDVRFDESANGVTRFVLTLPLNLEPEASAHSPETNGVPVPVLS
jgi:two-component system NtrC family sensor kinase